MFYLENFCNILKVIGSSTVVKGPDVHSTKSSINVAYYPTTHCHMCCAYIMHLLALYNQQL